MHSIATLRRRCGPAGGTPPYYNGCSVIEFHSWNARVDLFATVKATAIAIAWRRKLIAEGCAVA